MTELVEKLVNCCFCGELIVKMNGRDPDSYSEHHISYVPEIKTDSHIGCHIRFHMTNKDYVRRPIRKIPKKGCPCFFCGEPIVKMNGWNSDSLLIHSLDGNHDNWAPENKVNTHFGCHQSFHCSGEKNPFFGVRSFGDKNPFFGKKHTEKAKEEMRQARLGKEPWNKGKTGVYSEKTLKKMSLVKSGDKHPFFGKHHKPETIEKMRKAKAGKYKGEKSWNYGKHLPEETKEKMRQWWANLSPKERIEMGRKQSEGKRKAKERRKNK